MTRYYVVLELGQYFGKIGKLLEQKADKLVLLLQYNEIVEIKADKVNSFGRPSYSFEVIRHEVKRLQAEITLLNLYTNGIFGYKRQLEYDTPEVHQKLDRLEKFKQEWELLEEHLAQYTWLLEVEEVEKEKKYQETKRKQQEFHSKPFPRATNFFSHQLTLF